MAKLLDLTGFDYSFLDIKLRDKNQTIIHLDIPTEELVQEFEALLPRLDDLKKGDYAAIREIYEIGAKLININLDFIQVTAEELRTTYNMPVLSMLGFFNGYLDALDALAKEKN